MTKTLATLAVGLLISTAACSKHDCDLSSGSDEATFGAIAEMTGGAHSCMVSNAELIATHSDSEVDGVAKKYQTFLASKGWTVEVKDHESTRANGKPLKGKILTSSKDGKTATTLVYVLTGSIVETVTKVS